MTWRSCPSNLVVVGSGVTGAEFRQRLHGTRRRGGRLSPAAIRSCPHEDSDARRGAGGRGWAERGVTLVKNAPSRVGDPHFPPREEDNHPTTACSSRWTDGRTVEGSHALMTVGSVPNTSGLGLERVGIGTRARATICRVDRGVAHTTVPGIYAAGDCTGLNAARLRGRHAGPHRECTHALGEGLRPDPACAR